eukprot:TRINITY_DN2190_c0_g2_i1.p1 TRINITY_DN2190_c0_g2~~TRINITY_DN2190_c0_g2_i1.p1  ORF type:complete len:438 (-),score=70.40 TRINITY_DN2190_c0_g2_i1:361-1575(-)
MMLCDASGTAVESQKAHDHVLLQVSPSGTLAKVPVSRHSEFKIDAEAEHETHELENLGNDTSAPDLGGQSASCCAKCAWKGFCSPRSWNCYQEQHKKYYHSCEKPAAAPSPDCCASCAGKKPFYSPVSRNCYASRVKDYYRSCPESQNVVATESCKVGAGEWCEASVPEANWTLRNCSGKGDMRVKVLTYNLFWWNLFGIHRGRGRSAGRLIEQAAQDEPFDVAAFQECDDSRRIMGDARMNESEYDYVRWGSNTLAFRSSRWEKLTYGKGEFVAEDENRRWKRGAHWVRLKEKSSGRGLFVLNHHGPLPVNSGGVCGGEATAYNLLRMIDLHSGPGDALLLVGDFNADGNSDTLKTLSSRMHLVTSDWVDNILSNCGGATVKYERNLGKGGSDHNALMAILHF